jgi:ethanolamine utilization protein EutN
MILGRMVGTVWATRKNPRLGNLKLALVRPYFWYDPSHDVDHLVAVDQVGAEVGQDVIVCLGQPGRWAAGDFRCPIEASVAAIVDETRIARKSLSDAQARFALRQAFLPASLQWTEGDTMAEDRSR